MRPEPSTSPAWFPLGLPILAGAALIALVGARHYASSWHDGSRLATVEALVDQHTWAIDNSIFVDVPDYPGGQGPYPDGELRFGTQDKFCINGRFYTDKPVPALLLAGAYQLWQWCGGPTARARPDWFCWALILAGAGLPYVIAVGCIDRLMVVLRLPVSLRLTLTASFALATLALPYTRQVNVHIELLAVLAALVLGVAQVSEAMAAGRTPWLRLASLGALAGLGYTFDLGSGMPLVAGLLAFVALRCRRIGPVLVTGLAVVPGVALHQAINYSIGGTWRPINAVLEYSSWPGCPFNAVTLTGTWKHTPGSFALYAASMLLGKKGFLLHNLPLLLALPATFTLWRRRPATRPELVFLAGYCVATWAMYAGLSNNSAGVCCSIRWFLPFLAPGFYMLALYLKECPERRRDLYVLSGWGLVFAALMWREGPWMGHMLPLYWPMVAAALLSWWACHAFALPWRKRTDSPARHGGEAVISVHRMSPTSAVQGPEDGRREVSQHVAAAEERTRTSTPFTGTSS
jgi:hypothetical protein